MMNCKNYKAQIEETNDGQALSAATLNHLTDCAACQTFKLEREKLAEMLQMLQPVGAPANFNFRVKARIRKQDEAVTAQTRRRVLFLVPTALTLLILGFVLIKNFTVAPQMTPPSANVVLPSQVESVQTQPQSAVNVDLSAVQAAPKNSIEDITKIPLTSPQTAKKQINKPHLVNSETRVTRAAKSSNLKNENKEIRTIESAVTNVKPSITARGIPDPLKMSQKQDGKGLLKTFNVETSSVIEGLRVISVRADGQGAKAGLEAGDLIEKINGENPMAVSGSEFSEMKLTVRRKNQIREIIITAKP